MTQEPSVGAIQWSDSDPYGYSIHSTSLLGFHGPIGLVQAVTGVAAYPMLEHQEVEDRTTSPTYLLTIAVYAR
jgi:hypothetical protein